MNKGIRLLLICIGGLVLGLLATPVLGQQAQPIRPSSYFLDYPPPGGQIQVYAPFVYNYYPPYPFTPVLNLILTPENGSFTLSWAEKPVQLATLYVVQEATDPNFTQNLQIYETTQLYFNISGKIAGTFYYRILGHNSWGFSSASNVQQAIVLMPEIPNLLIINNDDGNNVYVVNWTAAARASTYELQESKDALFTSPITIYSESPLSWTTPAPGKTPAQYYYRVRSWSPTGYSDWSNVQSVFIHPLYVGLNLRWDGVGYIRGSYIFNVGTHRVYNLDLLASPDIVRSNNLLWYDPDPEGWGSSSWYNYYSISTGEWQSSSSPGDPSWKWGYPWMSGYNTQFSPGQIAVIDGQPFTVTGPIAGYTAFGKPVQYWQLVNKNNFLYWDGGGDWKQYCHPGDVILQYDAGETKLLLHSSVMRRDYYKGGLTSDSVQYIENLTAANSFQGMSAGTQESLPPSTIPPQKNNPDDKRRDQEARRTG